MVTEFGGIAYEPGEAQARAENWGYFTATTAEELMERYRALLQSIGNAPLLSGFCYTQFADTFQEVNGLLYADRTPKLPLEALKAATLAVSPGKERE
jgi:hypothetical protein